MPAMFRLASVVLLSVFFDEGSGVPVESFGEGHVKGLADGDFFNEAAAENDGSDRKHGKPPATELLPSSNRLLTEVPTLEGELSKLPSSTEEVRLRKLSLSGPLPADLPERFPNLTLLDLGQNHLSGEIPESLWRLPRLRHLDLSSNQLAGSLPEAVGFAQSLVNLDLSRNGLAGPLPPAVGEWRRLQKVHLHFNTFSGRVPEAVGNWSDVRSVVFSKNAFTGQLPEQMGGWDKVEVVGLDDNGFTGPLPLSVQQWTELKQLSVARNGFSGELEEEIMGSWSKLRVLVMRGNSFHGPLPRAVGNWTELLVLQLDFNDLSGRIPEEVGRWGKVQHVSLAYNSFHGPLPRAVGNWSLLASLQLSSNRLSGELPEEVGAWGKLQTMSLSNNRFTGPLPKGVGAWRGVRILGLARNEFSGSLPSEVWGWQGVEILELARNKFSGPLPREVGNWSSVRLLHLYSNSFSGELPQEIGQLGSLKEAWLGGNRFEGVLPDLSGLLQLRTLNMTGSRITGTGPLPPGLSKLLLDRSELRAVPEAVYELPSLTVMNVAYNNISAWPLRGVLIGKMEAGSVKCGRQPQEPRFLLPKLAMLDASGNAMAGTSARSFLSSLAYLPRLTHLACRGCMLTGLLHPEVLAGLADDQEDTGDKECKGYKEPSHGFPALQNLDLSQNGIAELLAEPPQSLLKADFSSNALEKLDMAWFNAAEENSLISFLVQGNAALQLQVMKPRLGCGSSSGAVLVADPYAYESRADGHECTSLCPGVQTRYRTDSTLNASALCRCRAGYAGQGTSCFVCPAHTFSSSDASDRHSLIRECRPCPDNSTTHGTALRTGIEACLCPPGTYLNASAAACTRCPQWPYRATKDFGETQASACRCNTSYEGLKEASSLCGCDDGLHMNHREMKCQECSNAEHCSWGTEIARSLAPPAVKEGFWAEPVGDLVLFSRNSIWRCSGGGNCLDNGVCAKGRVGRACSLCQPRTHGRRGPCVPCSADISPQEHRWRLAGAALGIGVPAVMLLHLEFHVGNKLGLVLHLRAVKGSLKQTVKHLQRVSVIGNFGVAWPELALVFFDALDRFTIKVPTLLAVGCLGEEVSATTDMLVKWAMPMVLVVVAVLAMPASWALAWAVRRLAQASGCLARWLPSAETCSMGPRDVLRVLLFNLLLFWSTLTANTFEMLTCVPSPNGEMTVATYPHLRCSFDEAEFLALALLSVFSFMLYLVMPMCVIWSGYSLSSKQVAGTQGEDRGWHAFLFEDYRDSHMDWTLRILAKDALFVVIPMLLPGQGAAQLLLTTAFSALHICLVCHSMPFRDRSNSLLEAWNGATAAALCIYSVGMGYEQTVGMEDVEALFQEGFKDPTYQGRAVGMVVVQCVTVAVPTAVLLYQLLCAFEKGRGLLPRCARPMTEEEAQGWIRGFLSKAEDLEDFGEVLRSCDEADFHVFRTFMEHTSATMGSKFSGQSHSAVVRKSSKSQAAKACVVADGGEDGASAEATLYGLQTQGVGEASEVEGETSERSNRPMKMTL